VIFLTVTPAAIGYRVTAREFDVYTRLFSTPVFRPLHQLGKLRDVALDAILEAFAPLARIESVEGKQVVLRLKATGLPFRDKQLALVEPGDVFRPVIRYNDRDGNPRRVMPIPWTFCTVQESDAAQSTSGRFDCKLYTGLRSPLSGRRRGRVEQLALAVVPPRRPSTLTLQSRSAPGEPLAGYDVYAHPPDSKTTVLLGRTDRRGRVGVPPASHPLRVLLVRNGSETLARLPMIPGIEPEIVAQIANDDQRLQAEGFIVSLQEELVDLVTHRQVLITLAKARIGEGKLDEAKDLLDELQRLPTRADFSHRLAQRQRNLRAADSTVQAKIDALFGDTGKLIQQHLDPAAVEEVWKQLLPHNQPIGEHCDGQ